MFLAITLTIPALNGYAATNDTYEQKGGEVHYNWGSGAPSGLKNDNFTAKFDQSRTLNVGDYFVQTLADDRVRVTFDGKNVIDRWNDAGGQIDRSLITNVKQGNHTIQTDFYENTGNAAIFSDIVPFDHWLAYYYPNKNLADYPVDAKVITPQGDEKALVENNKEGSPTPKVPTNDFSSRYTTVKRLPAGEYIIRGKADDGMRVYIDGKLVIDEWDTGKWDKEHAKKITIQDNTAAFGNTNEKDTHLVEVQYLELGGGSNVQFNIQPYSQAIQCNTWTAEYYNNKELKGDAIVVAGKNSQNKIENIDFDWKGESPSTNIPNDNFSARYTKYDEFSQGDYIFEAKTDDGVRVYVDNMKVIDSWIGSAGDTRKATVPMTAGTHKVVIEYLELSGNALIQAKYYKSKEQPKEDQDPSYKEFVVQTPTKLYDEPSFLKKTNDILYPRTVVVTEERPDGWKKIKTSTLEKWIAPEGIKYNLQRKVKQYFTPSFEEKDEGTVSPQMVTVLDEQQDGWKKILTNQGTRWIAPEGINYEIKNKQTLYSSPNLNKKTQEILNPQIVKAIEFQQDGWFKIRINKGEYWIAPKDITYDLKQNVALYKEASFLSDKEEYGLMPQKVILVDEKPEGWKLIKTPYGNRWIAPEGISYEVKNSIKLYKHYGFLELQDVISSGKVAIIGELPSGWYQIKSEKGIHWIAPNGVKYKVTKDIDYTASNDMFSPKSGTIPTGTIVTIVDESEKILFNDRYVYGFLSILSMEPVEPTDNKYIRQPLIYATLGQISNIVTKGHDDEITEQIFKNLNDIKIPDIKIPDINMSDIFISDINIPDIKIDTDWSEFKKITKKMEETNKKLEQNNIKLKKDLGDINKLIAQVQQGMDQMNGALYGKNGLINTFDGMNKAIAQANEGMDQMNEALNGPNGLNETVKGMNKAIAQANEGMQIMNEALNGPNGMIVGINQALAKSNEGMQEMLDATNQMNQSMDRTINSIDRMVKQVNGRLDAPKNTTPSSDLKTIHFDFDFSEVFPTSSPEEKLRKQQRDEAMYNLLSGAPFTGNFYALGELISGKNLCTEEDLQASDYALNMLAVIGGGEVKIGGAFIGSISKVTRKLKLSSTKINLKWIEEFGDKYRAVEVSGTAKVKGSERILDRRVYQMNNIDWDYVSSNPKANGLSNLELAKKGRPPFYKDDTQIQLHHTIQKEPGSMVELPASKHEKYYKKLHGIIDDGESFRNDEVLKAQYKSFRSHYWKMRVAEYEQSSTRKG
ncbi:PA14 domain-containing protein [Bacillus sp. NPDC077411]|uniref:PA14 domain-containing protein n=1 Tax=Bacillus sp. NPDC077411 TaxID=3363947 RepID=UPI0037C50E84